MDPGPPKHRPDRAQTRLCRPDVATAQPGYLFRSDRLRPATLEGKYGDRYRVLLRHVYRGDLRPGKYWKPDSRPARSIPERSKRNRFDWIPIISPNKGTFSHALTT